MLDPNNIEQQILESKRIPAQKFVVQTLASHLQISRPSTTR